MTDDDPGSWNDPELRSAVGAVVMTCARVEWVLMMLASELIGGEAGVRLARGQPVTTLTDWCVRLAVPPVPPDLGKQIAVAAKRVKPLMDKRHDVVHGLWSGGEGTNGVPGIRTIRLMRSNVSQQFWTVQSLTELQGESADLFTEILSAYEAVHMWRES